MERTSEEPVYARVEAYIKKSSSTDVLALIDGKNCNKFLLAVLDPEDEKLLEEKSENSKKILCKHLASLILSIHHVQLDQPSEVQALTSYSIQATALRVASVLREWLLFDEGDEEFNETHIRLISEKTKACAAAAMALVQAMADYSIALAEYLQCVGETLPIPGPDGDPNRDSGCEAEKMHLNACARAVEVQAQKMQTNCGAS